MRDEHLAMKFTVRHAFDTDLDTYWNKIFFDAEYNRRLYEDILKFKSYKQLEQRDTGGGAITRTLRLEPGFDAPAVIQKLLGDKFFYTEVGNFDPVKKRWRYVITPSTLPDKVGISGDFWAEARGGTKIERIAECDITAKIFGVGGMLESFVEKQTRDSYEKAAAFTNAFIREKGLAR